jgi:superfamily II DNA or RNA helicase
MDYERGLVQHRERNDVIAQVVALAPKPVLVLIQRIEHGKFLTELLYKAYGREALFIFGGDGSQARNEALEAFRNNHVDVLVSSVILDEGVNLPNIRTLVLAGGGKAKHRLIQRMGRGMRSSTEKTRLLAFDFLDRGKYTGAHARARERVYRGEPAYTVYSVTKEDVLTALQNGPVKGAIT